MSDAERIRDLREKLETLRRGVSAALCVLDHMPSSGSKDIREALANTKEILREALGPWEEK